MKPACSCTRHMLPTITSGSPLEIDPQLSNKNKNTLSVLRTLLRPKTNDCEANNNNNKLAHYYHYHMMSMVDRLVQRRPGSSC